MNISPAQLTGRDETHLVEFSPGRRLCAEASEALATLQADAREAGFELAVASAHRNFERQQLIFNGKARCERPVHDDRGEPVDLAALSPREALHAILRFSALPGGSRHHWGTDLDVFDAAALPTGYRLQLTPEEVADNGMMGPFHRWLDDELAQGGGFFRPYAEDTGGVAVERWHLSYAPLATPCEAALTPDLLADALCDCGLELADVVLPELPALFDRYIRRTPEASL